MGGRREEEMKLSELLGAIVCREASCPGDPEITGISTDSRSVKDGDVFVAVRGHMMDGHDFLEQAVRNGASALVVDRTYESDLPTCVVDDTSVAAALLAKRFFSDPAAGLLLVGITGTNGKTSTSFLLESILSVAVGKTGIIGTIGVGSMGELSAATHTTPASVHLYRTLSEFLGKGCGAVVMEVSSHAAVQHRIAGLEFDIGLFMNISRDHLDYHETLDRYVAAKEMFVSTLVEPERRKKPGVLVYNADDERVRGVGERFGGDSVSFGFEEGAAVRGHGLTADLEGTRFDLTCDGGTARIELKLLGSFSACNALAAAAAARALGVELSLIKKGLERIEGVPGRFQVISADGGPKIVIDYAHTPDALERLLTFCRDLDPSRITTVFGCGGDRDRGKRPIMGRIASEISDEVYVTDDNPRTEDPEGIIEDILEGSGRDVHVIRDRSLAIRQAVEGAGEGEIVVVAGKGHETYQIFGTERIPFDDAEEARKALISREVGHRNRT
jgi:UDP-N-acetylmuramoyl-L-alanyl-D-glutamate--2,6-diaminopimelate ligase